MDTQTVVKLRAMTKDDIPALYRMYLEYPLMIKAGQVFGSDWLEKVCQDQNQFRFAIAEGEVLYGLVTMWWSDQPNGILSPTMWIDKDYQKKGIGLSALQQAAKFAIYQVHGVRKFQAKVYGYNEASLRLCAKFFGKPEAAIPQQVYHQGKVWPEYWFAKYRQMEKKDLAT